MVVPENYKKVLQQFVAANRNQRVILFAILKMDELVDKWSLIVSTDWINATNQKEAFSSLIKALQEQLEPEQLNEVARVVFYSPTEHLVGLMLEKFEEGQHIKEDARVNGNVVHEGYIIALNKIDNRQGGLL